MRTSGLAGFVRTAECMFGEVRNTSLDEDEDDKKRHIRHENEKKVKVSADINCLLQARMCCLSVALREFVCAVNWPRRDAENGHERARS